MHTDIYRQTDGQTENTDMLIAVLCSSDPEVIQANEN